MAETMDLKDPASFDDGIHPTDSGGVNVRRERHDSCLLAGLICEYVAIDCGCEIVGFSRTCDCLCVRSNCCLAYNHKHYGFGMTTNEQRNEICKVGCPCVECGLIVPTMLCASTQQLLCLQYVGSLPFHKDYVPEPVCAYYGLACLPELGCCVSPPPCNTIQSLSASSAATTFHSTQVATSEVEMYRD